MPNIIQAVKTVLDTLTGALTDKFTAIKASLDSLNTTTQNHGQTLNTQGTAIGQNASDIAAVAGRVSNLEANPVSELTVVSQKVQIASEQVVEFDLADLIGASAGDYNLAAASVYVRLENTGATGYPNGGEWMNAEAVCVYGLTSAEDTAFVYNRDASAIDVFVKVTVPKN